jgi:hypothetical protein
VLRLFPRGRDARLDFARTWAERRPRTVFLLQEESATWARSGPLRLLLPSS